MMDGFTNEELQLMEYALSELAGINRDSDRELFFKCLMLGNKITELQK
jgi:hypothetical protein